MGGRIFEGLILAVETATTVEGSRGGGCPACDTRLPAGGGGGRGSRGGDGGGDMRKRLSILHAMPKGISPYPRRFIFLLELTYLFATLDATYAGEGDRGVQNAQDF